MQKALLTLGWVILMASQAIAKPLLTPRLQDKLAETIFNAASSYSLYEGFIQDPQLTPSDKSKFTEAVLNNSKICKQTVEDALNQGLPPSTTIKVYDVFDKITLAEALSSCQEIIDHLNVQD
ncbi:hypothetical protein [Calothrix sp. PCC 7507]|uniref:hypothetical protein n=1 Tax=Calothrix sp. PCC 7507 TaxID=99598 RepID=UPI00029EF58A|nr:hypothetical protein [Calothrix sp. PCC 7507]AFY34648.1 hypothetical protein Cal7507_4272 [Calothrix sp. PCC 7507]